MDQGQQQVTDTQEKPQQLTMIDLEQYTVKAMDSLDSISEEVKKHKEMLEDGYINNPTYHEHLAKVNDAKKSLLSVKSQIDKTPGVVSLTDKLKDLKQRMKDRKQALSEYALEFSESSGTDTIEKNGVLYTIVKTAKLVRSK